MEPGLGLTGMSVFSRPAPALALNATRHTWQGQSLPGQLTEIAFLSILENLRKATPNAYK